MSKSNHNTKDHSTGEPNSIKLTYEKVEGRKNDNVEEDYDHLHQNQTNAHALSSENVYSHMTDNQYGLLTVITDDTYDHTVGREGEYGSTQVCQESENTYHHTWLPAVEEAANSQQGAVSIWFQRRQPVIELRVFGTKLRIIASKNYKEDIEHQYLKKSNSSFPHLLSKKNKIHLNVYYIFLLYDKRSYLLIYVL